MTISRFKEILPRICSGDTSFDPKGWTKDNPFWGHSAVVSLLAQSLFGGEIWGVNLQGTKFAKLLFHFWNIFSESTGENFTCSQFGEQYPGELVMQKAETHVLLANENTSRRFQLLQIEFEIESKKDV